MRAIAEQEAVAEEAQVCITGGVYGEGAIPGLLLQSVRVMVTPDEGQE